MLDAIVNARDAFFDLCVDVGSVGRIRGRFGAEKSHDGNSRPPSGDAALNRTDYALGEWAEARGSERVRLVHGPGIDAVLAEVSGTTTRALQVDAGGNVLHATMGGTISETRRYDAFGLVRASSGAQFVSRGFAGRPVEGPSGLVYLRARHYDPATGRFLQPDPIGIETDQLYAYAANNAFVYTDPSGLLPWSLGTTTTFMVERSAIYSANDYLLQNTSGAIDTSWFAGASAATTATGPFGFGETSMGALDAPGHQLGRRIAPAIFGASVPDDGGQLVRSMTAFAIGGAAAKFIGETNTYLSVGRIRGRPETC